MHTREVFECVKDVFRPEDVRDDAGRLQSHIEASDMYVCGRLFDLLRHPCLLCSRMATRCLTPVS
jgi:hypothetical protein